MNFFKDHDSLYKAVKLNYDRFVDMNTIWNWSEKRFEKLTDSYTTTISLLCGSKFNARFSYKYAFDNFTELQLFNTTPYIYPNMTEKEIMANNTVPVYTLQSRQYLYKLFQGYNSRKFSGFTNIKKWYFDNNIQKSDNVSPFAIFYEYLDWVITTDFIRNNYEKKMSVKWIDRIHDVAASQGFLKIREFDAEFQRLLDLSKDKKIASVVDALYNWCIKP